MDGCPGLSMILLASALVAIGCDQPPASADGAVDGAGGNDGDREADFVDAEGEEQDGDPRPTAGPMVMVMSEVGLVADRVCDLDGDGTLDNAIADLGTPASELMLAAVNAASFQTDFEQSKRTVFLSPWVDDLSVPDDPSIVMIGFAGVDPDDPPDRTDDFSGEEGYYARSGDLDGCGEPVAATRNASIDQGAFEIHEDATAFIPVEFPFTLEHFRLIGTIAPFGESAELFGCGFAPVGMLGSSEATIEGTEMTALELLIAGGAVLGLPFPGGNLDVDVDGDGLERVIVDDDGHVESCVDGDRTEIPGPECWADERMADGVSFTARIATVSAVFLGREPGWEDLVEGTCEDPPETSLFDAR